MVRALFTDTMEKFLKIIVHRMRTYECKLEDPIMNRLSFPFYLLLAALLLSHHMGRDKRLETRYADDTKGQENKIQDPHAVNIY